MKGPWIAVPAVLLALPLVTAAGASPREDGRGGQGAGVRQLSFRDIVGGLGRGSLALEDVRRAGMLVFTVPFRRDEGFGDGPFDPDEGPPNRPGSRPTLQGNGTILRVGGLDAQSCNECHSIVSHATLPPALGIGGVGGVVQSAIILPTLIDVGDSRDDRVVWSASHDPVAPMAHDGVADFNGRLANPPFLFGGGGVELLAKEMTLDLQRLLGRARAASAGTTTSLDTHGVSFGVLRTIGLGEIDLSGVVGVGFEDNTGRRAEDVLVVRPFGRKGENFSMRDFDRGAMQFHFGVQPVEVVGEGADEDGDGKADEVSVGSMTSLHVFDVTNPPPSARPLGAAARNGLANFRRAGCAVCHQPVLETRSRFLPLAFPELPEDPLANVYLEVDLAKVGFARSPNGGVYVPLFADLKRHRMGSGLAESFEFGAIANDEFTTARLWGIADTAPYLHDGRALEIPEAIVAHGGEAQAAREAFLGFDERERSDLVSFLETLRTPKRPNEDLIGSRAR